MLSALRHGGLDQVILHHTDLLDDNDVVQALQEAGLVFSHLNPDTLLNEVGAALGVGSQLAELYKKISKPAILSDILRAAILYQKGGIYMDVDTLTLTSLRPLLYEPQFVGLENIVWPHRVKTTRAPLPWARAIGLDLLRKALRRMPNGWRLFRPVRGLYFKAVNNAIIGGQARAPLFKIYLQNMLTLPDSLQNKLCAIAPDLLQNLIENKQIEHVKVYNPDIFSPLPPEIAEHWFRPCKNAQALLKAAIQPQTLILHRYASARAKPYVGKINPVFISKNKNNQLYSALVSHLLPELNTY